MQFAPASLRRWLTWLLWGLVPLTLIAEDGTSFSQSLAEDERTAAGVVRLNDEQRAALDAQVAREVDIARQGDVIAFAGTFSTRRPASEHAAAGLPTLTAEELAQLDGFVARALATRPAILLPRGQAAASTVETVSRRAQWRGEVTMMYGRGSGGSEFYGGSVTSIYDDPDRGFSAAISLGRYEGTGLYPGLYGRYPYGPGYGYGYGPGLPLRRR